MSTLHSLQVRIGQLRAKVRTAPRGSQEQIKLMADVLSVEVKCL